MSIFLFVFGIGLLAINRGFGYYTQANLQQGLQSEVAAISALLAEDGNKTNFMRCFLTTGITSENNRRDSIAMVGLEQWGGAIPLDDLNLPDWDTVIVYRTTDEEPSGRLLRTVVRPDLSRIRVSDVRDISDGVLTDSLPNGHQRLKESQLSTSVKSFEVKPDINSGLFSCRLILAQVHANVGGADTRTESLEATLVIYPQNTWPRLK